MSPHNLAQTAKGTAAVSYCFHISCGEGKHPTFCDPTPATKIRVGNDAPPSCFQENGPHESRTVPGEPSTPTDIDIDIPNQLPTPRSISRNSPWWQL